MAKVIFPHEIDLESSNVAVNTEDEWSAATTYGQDDVVQVTTATPHMVYKSLRGNNLDRPPADHLEPMTETATSASSVAVDTGSKTFTIEAGKSFLPGDVLKIAKTVTPRSVNMTAEVVTYSGTTLAVSVFSKVGEGTHAAWTITTDDEIGFWEEVGATDQWKMFDGKKQTQTVNAENIHVKLNTERVDYVAFFGLFGKTIELKLWDATETNLLWEATSDLAYGSAIVAQISDWFEYFFGEYALKEEDSKQLGVITFSGVLEIEIIAETGTDAKCGNVIAGRAYDIGRTQFGASARLVDWPEYTAKRNEITTYLPTFQFDPVYRKLASLHGKTTAWLGNETEGEYEAFIILGKFVDMNMTVQGPETCWATIDIEG